MQITYIILLIGLLAGCATSPPVKDPLPPQPKIASYPSKEDDEKISQALCSVSKGTMTKEEQTDLVSATPDHPYVQYYMGHMPWYIVKDYAKAAPNLKKAADMGFAPAQYEYAISNAALKGNVEVSIAYAMLAAKSANPSVSADAQQILDKLKNKMSAAQKKNAEAIAANVEAAYLPEFASNVSELNKIYFTNELNCH